MLSKQTDTKIENVAELLVNAEHPLFTNESSRYATARESLLAIQRSKVITTDIGLQMPSPEVSLRLLEHIADRSSYIGSLCLRLTIDDAYGCWALPLESEYVGGVSKYPLLTSNEMGMVSTVAHRFIWKTLIDPEIETNLYLDHICRHHACCNVMHLEPVTPKLNAQRGNLARRIESGEVPLF